MKTVLLLMALALPAAAADLTVASFNIRYANNHDQGVRSWKSRKPLVVEAIRTMNPDILGVQEALAIQIDFLAAELPDYASIGVGRDDGKRNGEYSAIFYRKDRLERDPAEGGTFWYSDTPGEAGSSGWGNTVVRICTWSRFTDRKSGRAFYLYNTHWDHLSQPSREKSGRLLATMADARRHPGEPVILCGDFNATETNPGLAYLLGKKVVLAGSPEPVQWANPVRSSFLVLHADVENRSTGNGWQGVTEGKAMIDHVLISKHWTVKKAWIEYFQKDKVWPSDHYPVASVLSLEKNP